MLKEYIASPLCCSFSANSASRSAKICLLHRNAAFLPMHRLCAHFLDFLMKHRAVSRDVRCDQQKKRARTQVTQPGQSPHHCRSPRLTRSFSSVSHWSTSSYLSASWNHMTSRSYPPQNRGKLSRTDRVPVWDQLQFLVIFRRQTKSEAFFFYWRLAAVRRTASVSAAALKPHQRPLRYLELTKKKLVLIVGHVDFRVFGYHEERYATVAWCATLD